MSVIARKWSWKEYPSVPLGKTQNLTEMLAFLLTFVTALPAVLSSRPHIVFILADDMGWDDVSFHGSSQIPTPNLDVLAAEGIMLNNYYAMQLCTPSRSALLSGLHPIRTGMQTAAIGNMAPWGLPLQLKLMPEHFKDLGYDVHMIGKWHLGFFKSAYTPLKRGFDTFYGYYTGLEDYFDHTSGGEYVGLDLRDNGDPVWEENGTYATQLFTDKFLSLIKKHDKSKPFFGYFSHLAAHCGRTVDPFQAPEELVRKFSYIGDRERTYYAGGSVPALGAIDGVDMWPSLSEGSSSPRREMLLNADPGRSSMAIRAGRYKLLLQPPADILENDRHPTRGRSRPVNDLAQLRENSRAAKVLESLYGRLHHNDSEWALDATVSCVPGSELTPPGEAPYLFDVESDPCETRNLATSHRRGWDDVSFHGSTQIPTPNLDVLASEGVMLNNYYVMHLCTPSRSALLTGLYPIRTGMQSGIILDPEPWGLPLDLKLMPGHFKSLGYHVHMIGKWHLGFFKKDYTPLMRGFDSFYGGYCGKGDYYDHTSAVNEHVGLDLRDNEAPVGDQNGTYATHLFTKKFISLIEKHDKSKPFFGYLSHRAPHTGLTDDPFQAPKRHVSKFGYIGQENRTYYAGMVDALDQSVGSVVAALSRAGMLNDTIIVFSSDNGAKPHGSGSTGGSNWPLRGTKATLWEGGLRAPAFVWSTRLRKRHRVSRQMMHIVDWLPTLYSAAGGDVSALGPIDGVDMWQALSEGSPSPRREVLHNVDPQSSAMAIRVGRYKLLMQAPQGDDKNGRYPTQGMRRPTDDLAQLRDNSRTAKVLKSLYGSLHHDEDKWKRQATVSCDTGDDLRLVGGSPYLFNIEADPCETRNLAASHRLVLRSLLKKLSVYVANMVPPRTKPSDPRSFPENFGGVWSPWLD
ncbi:arylsulfatase B-like isoform X4 [Haemaphysalis longicornis]